MLDTLKAEGGRFSAHVLSRWRVYAIGWRSSRGNMISTEEIAGCSRGASERGLRVDGTLPDRRGAGVSGVENTEGV